MLCLLVIEPRSRKLRGSLFSVVTLPALRGSGGRPAGSFAWNCRSETENLKNLNHENP